MAVQLIIDSACDLMEPEANALGVTLIPMPITFGDQEYLSGVNITQGKFYELLVTSKNLPTTSQPSPYNYQQAFHQVREKGDQAVVICMSSALSGTYQSVKLIAQDYEDCVWVVDSLNVTIGERLLLDYAITLREQGFSAPALAAKLEDAKQRLCVFGIVETLDYLVKGGRLSKAAGAAGTLLGIRPILTVKDGALQVVCKARGAKAAYTALNKLIADEKRDESLPAMTGHTGIDEAELNAYLATTDGGWDALPKGIVGSTVGTHTGPHLLCVGFFKKGAH